MAFMVALQTLELRLMSYHNDASSDCTRWSNAKLMREARRLANLDGFSVSWNDIPADYHIGWHDQVNPNAPRIEDFCRDQTRVFRDTWLTPVLDEIERRFVKA